MTYKDSLREEIEFLIKSAVERGDITQDQADKILQRAEDEDWLSELWQEIDSQIEEKIQEAIDEIKDEEAEEEEENKPEQVVFT